MKPYRGLTKDGKMVYGDVIYANGVAYIFDGNRGSFVDDDELSAFNLQEVIPASVAQQVGLKDKNGKEIYAGDKLQSGKRVFTVVWDEGNMQWKAEEEDNRYCSLPLSVWAISEQFEIIPPKLLEKSK